jgi:hypothetical protein
MPHRPLAWKTLACRAGRLLGLAVGYSREPAARAVQGWKIEEKPFRFGGPRLEDF